MQAFQAVLNKIFRLSIYGLLGSVVLISCQPNSVPIHPSPASPTQSPSSPIALPEQSTPKTPSSEETTQSSRPHPAFRTIFPALQYQTEVPILLPGYIPGDSASPLYAILESATASRYQILLAFTEDCNGGNACRLGNVSGQTATESPPLSGQPAGLRDGITGYFVDATCGANCSDATLAWEQDGYRYTVGIKAGDKTELVEMANSAIANGTL